GTVIIICMKFIKLRLLHLLDDVLILRPVYIQIFIRLVDICADYPYEQECTEIDRMVIMIMGQKEMMQFIQLDIILDVGGNTAPCIQQNRKSVLFDEIARRRF